GDGDLDAYVATIDSPDRLYLNDGLGQFTDAGLSNLPQTSGAAVVGDFDGDGLLDILRLSTDLPDQIWYGVDTTTLADAAIEIVTVGATANEGADRIYEIVVSNRDDAPLINATVELALTPDLGDVELLEVAADAGSTSAITPGPLASGLTDAVTLPGGGEIRYRVRAAMPRQGDAGMLPGGVVALTARVATANDQPADRNPADNSATHSDVLFASPSAGTSYFEAASAVAAQPGYEVLDAGDIDADGDVDLLVFLFQSSETYIARNDGAGGFTLDDEAILANSTRAGRLADLDGDGDLDVATGSQLRKLAMLNDGSGAFTAGAPFDVEVGQDFAIVDVDHDGDLDWLATGAAGLVVFANDGDAQFTGNSYHAAMPRLTELAKGDFDGDGSIDLAALTTTGEVLIWTDRGAGTFVQTTSFTAPGALAISVADFDGDGSLDLFIATEPFQPRQHPFEPPLPLIVGHRVWLNDGQGNMTDTGQILGDVRSYDSISLDVDADGDIDILTVDLATNSSPGFGTTLWINDGSATFTQRHSEIVTTNRWGVGALAADFDLDGDLDVVINAVDRPVWLTVSPPAADFDLNGAVDGGDFLTWQRQLGGAPPLNPPSADANADLNVDVRDLALWQLQFGDQLDHQSEERQEAFVDMASWEAAFGGLDELHQRVGGTSFAATQRGLATSTTPQASRVRARSVPARRSSAAFRPASFDDLSR
ncbi:MAG: VCBS repeat-containing protein, partial [Planctomycetales bacterium]|nr:VCBS repeat-containing protein [Planctomycetales bacterium]